MLSVSYSRMLQVVLCGQTLAVSTF